MTSTDHITGIAPSHSNRGNRPLINSVYALSFESDQDFERLHADLKKELRPIDPQEEETVLTIAKNCWLEHRLMRAQPMPFPRKAPVSESKRPASKAERRTSHAITATNRFSNSRF